MTIPLNELGDFLAGVFGPLAIFWLILGFLQQGKELQQSTKALELQAKELNNSVQQQKELVDVSRQQVKAEIESFQHALKRQRDLAKPNFIFLGVGGTHGGGRSTFNTLIKNTGGAITHVSITTDGSIKMLPKVIPTWGENQENRFEWGYENGKTKDVSQLKIRYTDRLGNIGNNAFVILVTKDGQFPEAQINPEPNADN